jgi:membrane associated rhomboid family serine protease
MNIFIIIATVIVSISAFQNRTLFHKLKFNAYYIKENGEWYRLFTGGFVHADWMHLGFNMFALWMFGKFVEPFFHELLQGDKTLGSLAYLAFYVAAIPMSSLFSYEKHKNDQWYNAVGASGAVSAVLFSFIVQAPFSELMIFPIPFALPSIIFGALYLVYSWYMSRRGQDNIGHDAHFFGAIFGVLVTLICRPQLGLDLIDQIASKF